jgi:hypothetical protein
MKSKATQKKRRANISAAPVKTLNRRYRWRQVVLVEVLDEGSVLDDGASFLVSAFDSLLSLLDSEADEVEPFSALEASLPLRA